MTTDPVLDDLPALLCDIPLGKHGATVRTAITEVEKLRSILSDAAPSGVEMNCDECGGDNDKCGESCWVHRARKAGINADTDEPMEWV